MTTNTGETVSIPNFYRKSQSNLARKQKKYLEKKLGLKTGGRHKIE
ncbi:hypothetical protein [Okeania sp. KiyG1]|nr:hypothetical protein [Okeania sp. KiyG1]